MCAIKYARANAAQFGSDPGEIILVGHSWGATIGGWVALGGDQLEDAWQTFAAARGGPSRQANCTEEDAPASVDVFIGIGGGYEHIESLVDEDPEMWQVLSPFSYIEEGASLRIFLLHGDSDSVVDPQASVYFDEMLLESGYDSQMILFEGFHTVPTDLLVEIVLEAIGE